MEMQYSEMIFNNILVLIEDILIILRDFEIMSFGLSVPNRRGESTAATDLFLKLNYDIQQLLLYLKENESKLSSDQKKAFNIITYAVFK